MLRALIGYIAGLVSGVMLTVGFLGGDRVFAIFVSALLLVGALGLAHARHIKKRDDYYNTLKKKPRGF